MHIEPGTTFKLGTDNNLLITEFSLAKGYDELYQYAAEVYNDAGEKLNEFKSAVGPDVLDMWVRRDAVLTGKYENIVDRALVLEVLHDPMALRFQISDVRWKFSIPWADVSYDELEQYANELYAMDVSAPPIRLGGAFFNSKNPITLREFLEREADNWGSVEVSEVTPTVELYRARLNEFIKTGKKDFS